MSAAVAAAPDSVYFAAEPAVISDQRSVCGRELEPPGLRARLSLLSHAVGCKNQQISNPAERKASSARSRRSSGTSTRSAW